MQEENLSKLLRQRGHEIMSQGTSKDILIPACKFSPVEDTFKNLLYRMMEKDSFRRSYRDWAYGNKDVNDYFEVIESYINLGNNFDSKFKARNKNKENRKQIYAHTFEWYVSELLKRDFGAKASGFNVRLSDTSPDDDFDVIAIIDDGLVYVECKTGQKVQVFNEIKKFSRRDREIAAAYSIFLFDRDYTFSKEGDDLPDISKEQARQLGLRTMERISNERGITFYALYGNNDRWFTASSGLKHLKNRLRHMLRYINLVRDEGSHERNIYKHTAVSLKEEEKKEKIIK